MKREIKFRLWLKPEHWNEEDNEGLMTNGLPLGGWDKWWLNLDNPFKEGYGLDGEFTLDMIEIMQYTGLKDSTGKEIYEGDIVEVTNKHNSYRDDKFVVTFEYWCFCLKTHKTTSFEKAVGFRQLMPDAKVHMMDEPILKVIGNIYENPELLE